MGELGRALALLLAGILVWAAAAKLRRPAETSRSFEGLGLPAPRVLAVVVPAIELGTGVWLVLAPAAAAWASLALLAVFTVVLGYAMATSADVHCACFGSASISGAPVSGREIVRNALLAGAAVVATGAGADDVRWPAGEALAVAALLALAGWAILCLWPEGRLR